MNTLLGKKREVTTEWHVAQAKGLLDVAVVNHSATALVYSCLEARIAIERFVFEMSVLAGGAEFSVEELRKAAQKGGIFELLKGKVADYRKHLEFCYLIFDVQGLPIRLNIPDVRRLKRSITALSEYCHPQMDPLQTVDDPQQRWFTKGVSIVQFALEMLLQYVSARGAMPREKMTPEVRSLFDEFLAGECDLRSARTQLELMTPVLEERMRQRINML